MENKEVNTVESFPAKQKLFDLFKKVNTFSTSVFILFFAVSCLIIYGRYVYFHPLFCVLIVIGCFLSAFNFRNGTWIKWVFIFPVIAMAIFIEQSGSPYRLAIYKTLFKGEVIDSRYDLKGYTDDEGGYNESHTETKREFILSPSESKTIFKAVETIINIFAISLIILMYFILNNWKLKIRDN